MAKILHFPPQFHKRHPVNRVIVHFPHYEAPTFPHCSYVEERMGGIQIGQSTHK